MRSDSTTNLFSRILALACLVCAGAAAFAQYPGIVQQDGRLFDANPLLGSQGRNYEASGAPPLLGNAAASGTLSRGMSLRTGVGYNHFNTIGANLGSGFFQSTGPLFQASTGIADVNTIGARVGSSALSDFRRDSTSVSDARSPYQGLVARPYYDPTTTVPTIGFQNPALRGNRQAFTPGVGASNVVDPRLDPRITTASPLTADVNGLRPGVPLSSEGIKLNTFRPRNSGIAPFEAGFLSDSAGDSAFPRITNLARPPRPTDLAGLSDSFEADPSPLSIGARATPAPGSFGEAATAGQRAGRSEAAAASNQRGAVPGSGSAGLPVALQSRPDLLDPRIGRDIAEADPRGQLPREQIQNPYLANVPSQLQARDPRDPYNAFPTQDLRQPNMSSAAWSAAPQTSTWAQPYPQAAADLASQAPVRALPGNDLFSDMQIANELARDPRAQWYDQMRLQVLNDPHTTQNLYEKAQLDANRFRAAVENQPIRTFASGERSRLNDALAKGEALLDERDYFGAVQQFELARSLDPENPLPLLGMAHAQLAAGEFMSAAHNLTRGLDLYPQVASFRLDLKALMGGGESVDIRRSELIERLRREEDPRLRFLLGYLEYFSGRTEAGMKNFERAAQDAVPGSLIGRFPRMLRQMRGAESSGGGAVDQESQDPRSRNRSAPAGRRSSTRNPWDSYTPLSRGTGAAVSIEPSYLTPEERKARRSQQRSSEHSPFLADTDERGDREEKSTDASFRSGSSAREPQEPGRSSNRSRSNAGIGDLQIPKPKPVPVDPK